MTIDPSNRFLDDDRNRTAALRNDIARTRERLGETAEALGAQLNPSHLADRLKDGVREATIGKVQHMALNTKDRITDSGRDFANIIRENPIPAAMAAAGIGWLLLSRRDQSARLHDGALANYDFHTGDRLTGGDRVREMTSGVTEKVHEFADKASEARDRVVEKAHDATDRLTSKAQDTAHRVAQTAKAAGERVSATADSAMHQVRDRTRAAANRVEGQYQEHPMALGAVALALGLAIGISAPRTRREVEIVGDASDRLMDKAREQIASTTDRVEGVIDRALPEVKEIVREAAREEGLAR